MRDKESVSDHLAIKSLEENAAALQRQQSQAETRTAQKIILQAAIHEFALNGLHGARIDAIVARSNINKRILYHHFKDKESLYRAALLEIVTHLRQAELRQLQTPYPSASDSICAFARFLWRYCLENPYFVSFVSGENHLKGKYMLDESGMSGSHAPFLENFKALLTQGVSEGQFRSGLNALRTYMTISGLCFYYIHNRFTLMAAYGTDLETEEALQAWEDHIVTLLLASISKTGRIDP
ncbi:TetR family transcriptional regulator [Allorhizobium sp. BGMRC 0089]|uniref:TetR/AcrR family transcriptional regulator n=1 Tax=Allorhizobium sonneratiae TaxID=2934936 RepID=UPI0020336FC9|nr:TetR/AcrR family transcriptional regulator [Allorhizobium sonneratiae]MCM2293221.1 TetR family transcriptional regulator [Allorhizobium sonneratiae]